MPTRCTLSKRQCKRWVRAGFTAAAAGRSPATCPRHISGQRYGCWLRGWRRYHALYTVRHRHPPNTDPPWE